MTTRVTIEVNGAASVQTLGPAAAQGDSTVTAAHGQGAQADGGNSAGSAPGVDASQTGPVPFVGGSNPTSAASNSPFSREGAISAGPAPAELMGRAQ